ncbi:hypothetical protein NHN26_06395 [Rhodovulum tesquicola]|uniref:hypothetical protein n=1 Tax=Rhodovulum tesquicola TaxID=540254 RepID=UPI002097A0EA|nr:hypothetical protein [Rhodovulum tesquicola]MCO8144853.1 hypothetical protein [Rhodovulum tesquicola]
MTKTLCDLQYDAADLAALLGGLDALHSMCAYIPPDADIETRRASNARTVLIEEAIRRADELARDIEDLEAAERGARMAERQA